MVSSDPIDTITADGSVKSIHLPLLLEAETAAESEKEGEQKAEKPKRVTHVRQLFVGNLPFRVRWQDLKDLFRKAGNVQRADVALSFEKRSKGHGTVLFATVEDAQRAIDMLHSYKWQGRVLEVREDRGFVEPSQHILLPQLQLQQQQQQQLQQQLHQQRMVENMRANSAEIVPGGRQLFVGNLPFHCQWQDVKDLFRNAGNILRADVVQGPDGRSRGFGTVLFATHEDAKKAMAMYDGFEFHGRQLRVHFDKFAPGPLPHHHQPPSAPRFTLGPATFRPRPNFAYMQPPLPYPITFPSPLAPSTPPITSPTASTIRLQQHLQSLATENLPRLLQHPFYSTPATLHQPQQYRQPYLPPPFEEPLGAEPILSTNPLVGSIGMGETIYSTAADSEIRPIFMHPWQNDEHKDEAFFSPPPPQRPPSLPISPDEELADAVKVISLTDGSAGLTPTATATTVTSNNSDVTAQANLLTSNSVWEPLSGFKY
ncbi:hypothetical protein BJV82DRAFT_664000 [Fennellomyces sp. T-0311]|nr:hypothetical protein BJV82DRAFT_664000 [Fennellomyces sp. T-0311]